MGEIKIWEMFYRKIWLLHRKSSSIIHSSVCQQRFSLHTFFCIQPKLCQVKKEHRSFRTVKNSPTGSIRRILTRTWQTTTAPKEWLPSVPLLQFQAWRHHRLVKILHIYSQTSNQLTEVAGQEEKKNDTRLLQ